MFWLQIRPKFCHIFFVGENGSKGRRFDVELHSSNERRRWRALAKLDYRVSKFPCQEALSQLGLAQCFDELCEVGQLTVLFNGENINSYQVLTLEFLSTLEVVTDRRRIRAMKFWMRNEPYELTMEDLKGMHEFTADDHTEPDDLDKNEGDHRAE